MLAALAFAWVRTPNGATAGGLLNLRLDALVPELDVGPSLLELLHRLGARLVGGLLDRLDDCSGLVRVHVEVRPKSGEAITRNSNGLATLEDGGLVSENARLGCSGLLCLVPGDRTLGLKLTC